MCERSVQKDKKRGGEFCNKTMKDEENESMKNVTQDEKRSFEEMEALLE